MSYGIGRLAISNVLKPGSPPATQAVTFKALKRLPYPHAPQWCSLAVDQHIFWPRRKLPTFHPQHLPRQHLMRRRGYPDPGALA